MQTEDLDQENMEEGQGIDEVDTEEEAKEEFLAWALDAARRGTERWSLQWQQMQDDFRFLGREHWPQNVIQARGADKPTPVFDLTGPQVRKIANEARANPPGIIIRRIDDAEDNKVAEILQGCVRAIEEESKAPEAYEVALSHSATGGLGFVFCNYETPDTSFTEKISVERISDPTSVIMDSDTTNEHDAQWQIWMKGMSKERVEEDYGIDAIPEAGIVQPKYLDTWRKGDVVYIAECWRKGKVKDTLYQLKDPQSGLQKTVWKSIVDMSPDNYSSFVITRKKPGLRPIVEYAIMSGAKVIHLDEWPSCELPIVPVFGNEDYTSSGKMYSGIVRVMIDPNRLYNYLKAVEMETIALAPRAPYLVAKGNISAINRQSWNTANVSPQAYLEYDAYDGDKQLPTPTRAPLGIDTQAILAGEQDILQTIGRITGVMDANIGEDTNDISGKAITARMKLSDSLNLQYYGNLQRSVQQVGKVILDMVRASYRDGKKVRYITSDGKEHTALVGNKQLKDPQTGTITVFDIEAGDYQVSINAGPSYPTKRAEAAASMQEFIGLVPPEMQHNLLDILAGFQDWPDIDRLVDRLKLMVDPQFQDGPDGAPKEDPQAKALMQKFTGEMQKDQQIIQKLSAHIQEMTTKLQKQELELANRRHEIEAKIKVAKINAGAKLTEAQMDNQADLEYMDLDRTHDHLAQATDATIGAHHKVLDRYLGTPVS